MVKKYGAILADPPWSYMCWDKPRLQRRTAESHYRTMTIDDICSLPIKDYADDNCALFMWAVWPSIFDANRVIEAWGFTYKTIAWVWAKLNPSSIGFHMGMGHYTRANTEPCLLAVRGSMPVTARNVMALIASPVRQHSRKPDEQYGKIDRLYPNANKIELFARRRHDPHWDIWGNEVNSDITMETAHE